MRHRLAALIGAATILAAACGSGTPSAEPGEFDRRQQRPPATNAPPPSVANTEDDLFSTAYAPADGADGGSLIIGDWQEANQFNPYYLNQTEANVASAVWRRSWSSRTTTSTRRTSRPTSRRSTTAASRSRATTATR